MGRIAKHKLILGDCVIGRNVCAALAIFLQTPKSNLAELVFDNAFINDEGTAVLAMGIVGNSTLKDPCVSFSWVPWGLENHGIRMEGYICHFA